MYYFSNFQYEKVFDLGEKDNSEKIKNMEIVIRPLQRVAFFFGCWYTLLVIGFGRIQSTDLNFFTLYTYAVLHYLYYTATIVCVHDFTLPSTPCLHVHSAVHFTIICSYLFALFPLLFLIFCLFISKRMLPVCTRTTNNELGK